MNYIGPDRPFGNRPTFMAVIAWKVDRLITITEAEYQFWIDRVLPMGCCILGGPTPIPLDLGVQFETLTDLVNEISQ